MDSKLLKAIIKRYGNLKTFYQVLNQEFETVIINLEDDTNGEIEQTEIINQIQKTL